MRQIGLIIVVVLAAFAAPSSAEDESHWAYEPVSASNPPTDTSGWARNEIDRFIAEAVRRGSKAQ